jgi:SRSO17 transposase
MTQPRPAKATVKFVDNYCQWYQSLFPEVRSFEAFKHLHVGMISDIKRKSLPAIAKVVGLEQEQSLHHFLSASPWKAEQLRQQRLKLILQVLEGREIILIIDETGDRKKGDDTDYVKRQYIGNLGKIENGIVAVTAYGVIEGITFPLTFEVYKPKERLQKGDTYLSKPEIAAGMIRQLQAWGFRFKLVLADSLYGESGSNFIDVLYELKLPFVVAIRSNHAVWLPKEQTVRCNRWREFKRIFSDGTTQQRYIREIIFGKRRTTQFWQITTDKETLPKNATWYVMTHVPDIKYYQVGNFYGLRNWVEYGLKQSKNELGWSDFRVTDYTQIQKWWEVVMSAYLLVSLHTAPFHPHQNEQSETSSSSVVAKFSTHPWWNQGTGWKNLLNNLRLILQPFVLFNLIQPWLKVFPIPALSLGFPRLIALMNHFQAAIPISLQIHEFLFSAA